MDRRIVEQDLGNRHQGEAWQFTDAALGLGIKNPDAFQRIAKEIEPPRQIRAGRKNIDKSAAHGEIARLDHRACAGIAIAPQIGGKCLDIHSLSGTGDEAIRLHHCAGRHPLHRRIHRGDDDQLAIVLLGVDKPVQRGHALTADFRVGGHPVIGQTIPGGKSHDLDIGREITKRFRRGDRARSIARNVQDRLPRLSHQRRQHHRVKPFRRASNCQRTGIRE